MKNETNTVTGGMTESEMTVKLWCEDIAVGSVVTVGHGERIFDRDGRPLADTLTGTVEARVVEVGAYWSDSVHGRSGRYYVVRPLTPLPPAARGRERVLVGA